VQFTEPNEEGAPPVRVNDWTMVTTVSLHEDMSDLRDDVLAVSFPWIEIVGTGTTCSDGNVPTVSQQVIPHLGTTFPASVGNLSMGAPAVLILSWYKDAIPLDSRSTFYLDAANVFGDEFAIADFAGVATVNLHLQPLPWLAGLSVAGQWGVYDAGGYNDFCVSSGFRIHLE
jgi:hypothetical protein